jgi:hypothetical protein
MSGNTKDNIHVYEYDTRSAVFGGGHVLCCCGSAYFSLGRASEGLPRRTLSADGKGIIDRPRILGA